MGTHRHVWKIAFVGASLLVAACDSSATTPRVQNVTYVTNVYTQPQTPVFSGDREIDQGVTVSEEPSQAAGIPACEAYFSQTESCVQKLTSDPAALAQFEGRVQVARSEAARAEASDDPGQIAHATSSCVAALSAYRLAPCGG